MQDKNKKIAESFYSQMKFSHGRLSHNFATKDQLDHLGALITQYGKNIGGGDNAGWRELHKDFQPIFAHVLRLSFYPPATPGADNFCKYLYQVVNMAWALQLKSPPESDQILKQIWELCGEIADKLEDTSPIS